MHAWCVDKVCTHPVFTPDLGDTRVCIGKCLQTHRHARTCKNKLNKLKLHFTSQSFFICSLFENLWKNYVGYLYAWTVRYTTISMIFFFLNKNYYTYRDGRRMLRINLLPADVEPEVAYPRLRLKVTCIILQNRPSRPQEAYVSVHVLMCVLSVP